MKPTPEIITTIETHVKNYLNYDQIINSMPTKTPTTEFEAALYLYLSNIMYSMYCNDGEFSLEDLYFENELHGKDSIYRFVDSILCDTEQFINDDHDSDPWFQQAAKYNQELYQLAPTHQDRIHAAQTLYEMITTNPHLINDWSKWRKAEIQSGQIHSHAELLMHNNDKPHNSEENPYQNAACNMLALHSYFLKAENRDINAIKAMDKLYLKDKNKVHTVIQQEIKTVSNIDEWKTDDFYAFCAKLAYNHLTADSPKKQQQDHVFELMWKMLTYNPFK